MAQIAIRHRSKQVQLRLVSGYSLFAISTLCFPLMPPKSSQKRAVGSNGDGPSSGIPRKKTRFVEPSEDPVNFAEEVDAQLETSHRRGRVKTEGYESDSSDDGEGVVPSRKPGVDGAVEDEDEDMFAMGEKEEKKAEESGKKKKEEYLRLGDIEGQEFGGGSGSGESSEDDEPEDLDDARRRQKAGMGYELSSFNMREEMEEGKFAADGTYVRSFDPHATHDRWLEDVDEKAVKRARRNHRHQERLQKEKMKAEEQELQQLGGKDVVEMELLGMLKKGETVLEALQRMGAKAKKGSSNKRSVRPNNKSKRNSDSGAMDVDSAPKPSSEIDHITHLASTLMSLGDTDIYSKTYEGLVRSVRSAGKVDASWVPPSADVKYEYKWDVPGYSGDDQVFGPFSEEEMQIWFKAAYFGIAGEKVHVRNVGGDWGHWADVVS
ncbi:LIN1-like protein [Grifola frondosa]|uniref:LIN1-like protein n=1 Tax=Grifola frondosa TaxID=5627 RepID=A0A1C7MFA5_GRIFR|nr:LIN1-like protein [Grifola frondosa]